MKNILCICALLLSTFPLFGQATTGYHRVNQVIARSNNGTYALVVPFASISVKNTATGSAATIYYDPLLSSPIPSSLVIADLSGNYNYYMPLNTCNTEVISSPGQSNITIPNICGNPASSVLLQTNGNNNGVQSLLNLVAGTGIVLANSGGNVTINSEGGVGVTSINTVTGAFTFNGGGVSCSGTTCTFSGGGGGSLSVLTNNTTNASQSVLNFTSANGFTFTNPSGGLEEVGVDGTHFLPTNTGSATTFLNGAGAYTTPGTTLTLQTIGSNNASQTLLNFIASTTNAIGLTVTPSNPSGGTEKFEVTGTLSPSACPLATTSAVGCVKPDGTTITISGGVITAVGGGSGGCTTNCIISNPTLSQGITQPTGTDFGYVFTDWPQVAAMNYGYTFDAYTGDIGGGSINGSISTEGFSGIYTVPGWCAVNSGGSSCLILSNRNDFTRFQSAGIANGYILGGEKLAAGDFNLFNPIQRYHGGSIYASDEGVDPLDVSSLEGAIGTGTVTSGSAGTTTVGINLSTPVGTRRLLLNTSRGGFTATQTMTGSTGVGTGVSVVSITTPSPLAISQCGTFVNPIEPIRAPNNALSAVPVVFNINLASAYTYTTGDLITFQTTSGPETDDLATATGFSYSGGVETFSMSARRESFTGSIACLGGFNEAFVRNTTIPGEYYFHLIGTIATTGTTSTVYELATFEGNAGTSSGISKNYTVPSAPTVGNVPVQVYQGAEIESFNNASTSVTIDANPVGWTAGDTVEVPNFLEALILENHTFGGSNPYIGIQGLSLSFSFVPNIQGDGPKEIELNSGVYSNVISHGGMGNAPTALYQKGPVGMLIYSQNPPSDAYNAGNTYPASMMLVECVSSPCNSEYGIFIDKTNGHSLTYNSTTPSFNFNGGSGLLLEINGHQVCDASGAGGGFCNTGTPGTVTSIGTTGPITGGTITTSGTIACATCVTAAAALTANRVILGSGGQAVSAMSVAGVNGVVLHGATGGPPVWASVDLTTDISGVLNIANGGTGTNSPGLQPGAGIGITLAWPNQEISCSDCVSTYMTTLGDTLAENSTPLPVRVAGNTTTTRNFYRQTGTGSVSALPVWDTLVSGDIPNNAANTTGNAATSTTTNALQSATTTVNVSSATAPTSGQVLTATSGTAATWQTASGGTPAYPQTVTGCVSGGILYGSLSTQVTCSPAGTAGQAVLWGGAGTAPTGKALAGSGAGITTGPTTAVSGDVITATGTAGQIADSGTLLTSLAPLASPTFTGVPAAPTATLGTNTTQVATTAFVLANAGGLSGLTTNTIPKATSSTAIGNSLLTDNATTLTYNGTGGITIPPLGTATSAAGGTNFNSAPLHIMGSIWTGVATNADWTFTVTPNSGTSQPQFLILARTGSTRAEDGLSVPQLYVTGLGAGAVVCANGSKELTACTGSQAATFGAISGSTYATATNCAAVGTSASPSLVACTSAAAGAFSCATTASAATCIISDTAVTANSEIEVQEVAYVGTRLGVTCNTAPTLLPSILQASIVAGTSFTINMPTITVNPACFIFTITN